jgi:hypothetical protein
MLSRVDVFEQGARGKLLQLGRVCLHKNKPTPFFLEKRKESLIQLMYFWS